MQTPIDMLGTQFYGTVGAEGYQETLGAFEETHFGTNIGGGAKIKLVGPLRVRLDYRDLQAAGLAAPRRLSALLRRRQPEVLTA